ncbi:dihydrofolate reductase family protein [Nonomuraea sp. M3C6]|uniref:Dihydrofolate reductase family protein n=1 Tax=Nonomuraea marmarensis TaxID=3351344 RepID=A0ABW7AQY0_9ACTN
MYVVSVTLTSPTWENTTVISGDPHTEPARLRQLPGKDTGITGSATLATSLLRDGLLDELNLLGTGKRLFEVRCSHSAPHRPRPFRPLRPGRGPVHRRKGLSAAGHSRGASLSRPRRRRL